MTILPPHSTSSRRHVLLLDGSSYLPAAPPAEPRRSVMEEGHALAHCRPTALRPWADNVLGMSPEEMMEYFVMQYRACLETQRTDCSVREPHRVHVLLGPVSKERSREMTVHSSAHDRLSSTPAAAQGLGMRRAAGAVSSCTGSVSWCRKRGRSPESNESVSPSPRRPVEYNEESLVYENASSDEDSDDLCEDL